MARHATAPALAQHQWQRVRRSMKAVAGCACNAERGGPLARLFRSRPAAPVAGELAAVHTLMCSAALGREPSGSVIDALRGHGYSEVELEAIALLAG
ncbi:hypothetical protein [Novosphingobium huizhouense]|uniref:hypothetical protein n=1 Tax=Novosphingobium huizhouense TaxID=2866625 RepID=UPI001CD89C69|nr:hypothetical protein [Novosphingobium huizhouense]